MSVRHAVPRQLALLVGVLTLIIAGVWGVGYFAMESLSAVRAYVRGEGHWSKAEKQAVQNLYRYVRKRDERDYYAFLARLEVPAGALQARLEMEKDHPDRAAMEHGLLKAGNQPEDLKAMVNLFRRFKGFPHYEKLLYLWTRGDHMVQDLRDAGQEIHREIQAGHDSPLELKSLLDQVDAINAALAPLQDAFSATLGSAARQLKKLVWRVQTTAMLLFLAVGCWMAFRLSRTLSEREIYRLNQQLARHIQELGAANKELDSFCYSVSHDLRAPLRALRGYSEMLDEKEGTRLTPEGHRLLSDLRRNGERMNQLLDGLLSFSRLSLEPLRVAAVDMTTLAGQVAEELRAMESGRNVVIEVGTLEPVQGDATLLRQVLANLIGNALKFTRPRPEARVRLASWAEPERVVYSVEDNGVGFDEPFAAKLFGVFQRLHSEKEFEGTGVGLALVQRIIARHGGSVWAKSKAGEGSTFYFALPR
jgi:signal transduction histidine kinase